MTEQDAIFTTIIVNVVVGFGVIFVILKIGEVIMDELRAIRKLLEPPQD